MNLLIKLFTREEIPAYAGMTTVVNNKQIASSRVKASFVMPKNNKKALKTISSHGFNF